MWLATPGRPRTSISHLTLTTESPRAQTRLAMRQNGMNEGEIQDWMAVVAN